MTRFVATVVFSICAATLAQATAKPAPAQSPVSEIEFGDGETIEGVLPVPGLERLAVDSRAPRSSLIRLRNDFNDKVLQSASQL